MRLAYKLGINACPCLPGRGQLTTVLKLVEADTEGTFHGLGSIIAKRRTGGQPAQVTLHRKFKIPVRILAEPRPWYKKHREPQIEEASKAKDRVLVRFNSDGYFGSFHGTCLYALRNGEWGCYTIRPNASETIATAEK